METANNSGPFRRLLELLETATSRNQLHWESTPDDEVFRARLGPGHVWFARYPEVPPGVFSPDATPGRFTITLMDPKDKVIERLYAVTEQDITLASEFFSQVRRKILHLDQLYKNMLDELQRKANQPSG